MGVPERLRGGWLVSHPARVTAAVLHLIDAPPEPLWAVAGVVLPGLLPPRPPLGLPELAHELVQRPWAAPRLLAVQAPLHFGLQGRHRIRRRLCVVPVRRLPGRALVVTVVGVLVVVVVQHRLAFHPQQHAGVEQRPPRRPQISLVECRQELVGHRDDVDVPGLDLAALGQPHQHRHRLDRIAVGVTPLLVAGTGHRHRVPISHP